MQFDKIHITHACITSVWIQDFSLLKSYITKYADSEVFMEGKMVIKSVILQRKKSGMMCIILLLYFEWRNKGLKEIRE